MSFTTRYPVRRIASLVVATAVALGIGTGLAAPASAGTAAAGKAYAESQARTFGVAVSWYANGKAPCGSPKAAGCYLPAQGKRVNLNAAIQTHVSTYIRYVVAHEASHAWVNASCGAVKPGVVGSRMEQVADALTIGVWKVAKPASGTYGYTAADLKVAQQLKAGVCTPNQQTVTTKWSSITFRGYAGGASYALPRGSKLTIVQPDKAFPVVRDSKGRLGRVDVTAWAGATSTKTAAAGTPVYGYEKASLLRREPRAAKFSVIRTSGAWVVAADASGNLVQVHGSLLH
jgi:hypothetical protein